MACGFWKAARLFVIAVAAGVIGLNAGATPGCDPGALTVRADRIASYMPFSEQAETINIRLDGTADTACRVAVRLSSGTGGGLQKGTERLEILIRTRQGQTLHSEGSDQVSITLLPVAGKGVSADLIAVLHPRQLVRAGFYEGAFELEVISSDQRDRRAAFSLAAIVASQADIRLAGRSGRSGGTGVDFGVLERGKEETAFVSIRSNAAYAVELGSANGWFLELAGSNRPDDRIAYSTWFNDLSVPRQSIARIPERFEPTGHRGSLSRLRFRIGDTAGKPAGTYQDTVRLTVILLE